VFLYTKDETLKGGRRLDFQHYIKKGLAEIRKGGGRFVHFVLADPQGFSLCGWGKIQRWWTVGAKGVSSR